ncbi:MAG TPA: hypothetical protein VLJ21_02340, partial [Candidatus Binatia bacterium]|nr:hypothetical protein [Candidatus Binatia bacterium]
TDAAREVFTHGKDAWLVPAGNPGALADAILALANDASLRQRLATAGQALFWEKYSIERIGAALVAVLNKAR